MTKDSFYNDTNKEYIHLLNEKQLQVYKNIIKERTQLSLMGYVYGFILSCIIIIFNYSSFLIKKY